MAHYSTRREQHIAKEVFPSAMSAQSCSSILKLPEMKGLRMLDIGSGESDYTFWLNSQGAVAYAVDTRYKNLRALDDDINITVASRIRHVAATSGTSGVTIYKSRLETARYNFRRGLETNGMYVAALAGNLPFQDKFFDIVFSIDCIGKGLDEDEPVFTQAILESLRVLRHGGQLIVYPYLGYGNSRKARNQAKVLRGFNFRTERIGGNELDYPFLFRIQKP